MARANYCEFFRFDDRYCDVFEEEPGRYLYAEAEFWNYAGMLTCKEYVPAAGGGWIVSSYSGADTAYLASLEPAPADIAADIIRREYARTLYYSTRGDSCAWYGFDDPPTMTDCIEQAETYAGELVD